MNRRNLLLAVSALALAACASTPPAPTTIAETAQRTPELSTLSRAISAADLQATLAGPGPFTVFAPSDAAFAKLPKDRLDALLANKEQLRAVLTYHVVPGKVLAADVKNSRVKTVNGAEVNLSKSGDLVGFEDALVIKPNVDATNGVIHVIDTVMLPPAPRR